jgi:hypothetical protein
MPPSAGPIRPADPTCPTRRGAMRPRQGPRRWERWLIGALLLLGAAAYTAWVAGGTPGGQGEDVVAGLAVLGGSVIALVRLPAGRRPLPAAGWASLALFGAATAVDPAHGAAGSSTVAVLCAPAGLVALTVAARRHHCWPQLARVGPYLLAAELGATVWTLAATAAFGTWHVGWALGTGRRAQAVLTGVWLAVLGASVSMRQGGVAHNGGTTRMTPHTRMTPRTRMRAEDVKRAGNRVE